MKNDKKTLVVFTGWGFKAEIWKGFLDALGDGFKVIHYQAGKDLENTIKNEQEVYAMGWSKGGMQAVQFAVENPELVSKVVLFSTTARFIREGDYRLGWKKGLVEKMKLALSQEPKAVLEDFAQNMFSDKEVGKESVARFLQGLDDYYESRQCQLKAGLDYLIETDIRGQLKLLKADTLMVCGSDDVIVSPKASEYLGKLSSGHVDLDILDGVGHAPFISERDYCCRRVDNFLRGDMDDR